MMKRKNYQAIFVWINLLCLIFSTKTNAQVKKTLTVADYALWKSAPKIIDAETSADGNWYVYKTGNDSCLNISLKQVKGKSAYNFKAIMDPNRFMDYSSEPKTDFSKDGKHYAFLSNDTLHVIELTSGRMQMLKEIKNFKFAGDGQYLFAEGNLSKKIWLRDLKNQNTISLSNVEQFEVSPKRNAFIAIANKNGIHTVKVVLFKPGFPASEITSTSKNNFAKLTWNSTGTAVAFYETKGVKVNDTICKIHTSGRFGTKPELKSLDPESNSNLPKNYVLSAKDRLHLSADGKQLFFYLTMADAGKPKNKNNGIEVWLPTDLALPAGSGLKWHDKQLWYQWTPENNSVMAVTDGNFTFAVLTGDEKKALVYHTRGYLPRYKYINDFVDIYIKDLATGSTKLLLKKVWNQPSQLYVSPGGKYIAYFKDKNWWIYNIHLDNHRCLTEGFRTILENIEKERVATVPSYGSPGWLKDDSQLIIYDQHDIWLLSPDGKKKLKITRGAETNRTFRLSKSALARLGAPGPGSAWFTSRLYDGNEGLLISSINNETLDNGLHMWTFTSGLTKLINKPMAFTTYGTVTARKPFLFSESSFNVPPRLMLFNPAGKTEMLYETDPHQKDFNWGKSEVVHYTTSNGKRLKGALFYPADYVAGKRYPMVVEIYETMSEYLHEYQPPSLTICEYGTDLNTTNYTSEGYFVFFPDISYEYNDPGISATRCVVAGVEKVIEMGLADRDNIGLIGGSFGGYETAFIATQTNLIKTAISRCGITDLPTYSLLISQFGPNFTRVEEDQFRMTKTFLGEDYIRNSPMHYIHQMNMPILLISGDKDSNVDVSQSKSFHNALWRLGKPSTMLIYQGENHALVKPENQLDATRRIKNWFDHYLKGEKPADWMIK